MRQTQIFSGSSHPELVDAICNRLGQKPGDAFLGKFSNGETRVEIKTSIRDQDVFIVQSGSGKINDNVMELLIMIQACKGGSARSITAVMPYFPYSRQSKKKSHRGAITARMIANLLNVAGVNHVVTIDLHASQMQGFFKCPVDNLVAEPLLARWIRMNVPNWKNSVVVSKNPGGTKRVTSLADALKLSFGIVTTDRRRPYMTNQLPMDGSVLFDRILNDGDFDVGRADLAEMEAEARIYPAMPRETPGSFPNGSHDDESDMTPERPSNPRHRSSRRSRALSDVRRRHANGETVPSPLATAVQQSDSPARSPARLHHANTVTGVTSPMVDGQMDEYTDERARDVITGRLIHGHIVDDNFPSPAFSAKSAGTVNQHTRAGSEEENIPDHMLSSFMSTVSSRPEGGLGGSGDVGNTSDEEEEDLQNPELETTVTLVGKVKDRAVFIVDDMIDKAGSWIAAAETVVKRGGATQVYCMATHGLFGGEALREMEECECITQIIVTNAFPIPPEKAAQTSKLQVLDVSGLLAEAIRRNHHGESISQLFMHYD